MVNWFNTRDRRLLVYMSKDESIQDLKKKKILFKINNSMLMGTWLLNQSSSMWILANYFLKGTSNFLKSN